MKKSSSILITVVCLLFLSCSTIKTPPPGVDFESKEYHSEIAEFKYDLSYLTKDGDAAHETHIFNKVYKNIDEINTILKNPDALVLYQEFLVRWDEYEVESSDVLSLSRRKLTKEALDKIQTSARLKYNSAKEILNKLNEEVEAFDT